MGADSRIEWTDHTFNPWIGCTKVSAACDHCYAERFGARIGVAWGAGAPRRRTSAANWRQPLRWNAAVKPGDRRPRVFCASLADVFDAEVPDAWRLPLFQLIQATPNLDWLLLTKRPKLMAEWARTQAWPANAWAGTTVETQAMADLRIPQLLEVPARLRFLSCEPLLGEIDIERWILYALSPQDEAAYGGHTIDWVIVGGESGPGARPMHPDWARSLRNQCRAAGVPFFFKQWGEFAPSGDWRDGQSFMTRVGKKAAGRILFDREWNEVPEVPA